MDHIFRLGQFESRCLSNFKHGVVKPVAESCELPSKAVAGGEACEPQCGHEEGQQIHRRPGAMKDGAKQERRRNSMNFSVIVLQKYSKRVWMMFVNIICSSVNISYSTCFSNLVDDVPRNGAFQVIHETGQISCSPPDAWAKTSQGAAQDPVHCLEQAFFWQNDGDIDLSGISIDFVS